MSPEELQKMLGIKPKKVETPTLQWDSQPGGQTINFKSFGPTSESCYNLDDWEVEQGQILASRSGPHRTPLEQLRGYDTFTTRMADLFAACFRSDPDVENQNMDRQFHEFVTTLVESPDFQVLHATTERNLVASRQAAMEFENQFSKMTRKIEELREPSSPGSRSKGPKVTKDAEELACLNAVNAAIKAATAEVEQMEDVERALGCGKGGSAHNEMEIQQTLTRYAQVRNDKQLRRICELAGRYRMMAQAKQRQKTIHGYDEMIGVEQSGDLSRVLPVELGKLTDPDLELDTMRRLVEKQLLSRQYRGVENVGKGPIVVVVDESSSMDGEPLCNAKAFALAMYWIAKHQNRWCWLVSFASTNAVYGVLIPPNKPEPGGLIDWLKHNYRGGTDVWVPCVGIPKEWHRCPKGNTDMVIISDAAVDVPRQIELDFMQFKQKEKVKLTTIVIGSDAGELARVSDQVHCVSGIDVNSGAVSQCMSI